MRWLRGSSGSRSGSLASTRLRHRATIGPASSAARCIPNASEDDPPRLVICIAWREDMVESMYRRPWRLETDLDRADYVITTQHMNCAENRHLVLIDEVRRFDRAFAWTYARQPQEAVGPSEKPLQR
jgi:hypothetical protein